jgi:hypothetical protein
MSDEFRKTTVACCKNGEVSIRFDSIGREFA